MSERLQSHQFGISLMELIFGLAIAASVVTGGVSLSRSADNAQKTNQLIADVSAIRSGLKQLHPRGSYTAASLSDLLIQAKKLPATITNPSGTTLRHVFRGDIFIAGADAGAWFHIRLVNIPQEVCINLLTGLSPWPRIKVGSAIPTGLEEPLSDTVLTGKISPEAAMTACTATSGVQSVYLVSN